MVAQTYHGRCHCGAVRYEVTADLDKSIECNCSRCSKAGFILTFAPAESFSLKSGENKLTDYQFNKKTVHHLFCSVCGIQSFARGAMPDGKQIAAVNIRCLDGVDLEKLSPNPVNGRDF
jgi:hypothetical protein